MNTRKTIISAMLLLAVAVSATAFTLSKVRAHGSTVKVTVSKNGYSPSTIDVEKGHKVRLEFTRTDAKNCGGEVVFPSLNIRKKLPIGKKVVVEFTPDKTGDIAFTCGMGMMKGKIVVAEN